MKLTGTLMGDVPDFSPIFWLSAIAFLGERDRVL